MILILLYASELTFVLFEVLSSDIQSKAIHQARCLVAFMWSGYLNFWHNLSFRNLENIPRTGGVMLVWYHGPIPVDYFGLIAKVFSRDHRMVFSVVDKCLHMIPGLSRVQRHLQCESFSRVECASKLMDGAIIGVAPGGSREALFDDSYEVLWENRVGFAKVASFTQSPIIPIFSENIRNAYRTMETGRSFWRWVFEVTKLPLIPVYGGFPVEIVTHVGDPITAKVGETAEQLQMRVRLEMLKLMKKNQRSEVIEDYGFIKTFSRKMSDTIIQSI